MLRTLPFAHTEGTQMLQGGPERLIFDLPLLMSERNSINVISPPSYSDAIVVIKVTHQRM